MKTADVNLNSRTTDINFLLWIVLGVAAAIRLRYLTGFSLSNDELSALARLQYSNFSEVIKNGVCPDFHPAGVEIFLFYWTKIFGFSEWVVRLPFALMGTGSVYLLFKIGEKWFGPSTGLLAAAALATLEFPVLYSQIARPYSPGLFFSLLATYFWTKSLIRKGENEQSKGTTIFNFTGFALAVSCCMYTHYFSFIFAGILCFTGLFFLNKSNWLPYVISGILILLLYIPHIDIFMHQLGKGGVGGAEGWLGPPKSDAFGKYIDYCFNDSFKLKLIYFIIFTGTILVYRGAIKLSRFHIVCGVFFLLPFAIAYYYSIFKNPVFQHSVLLFSFPFLLLFVFSFIPRENTGFTLRLLFFSVLAGTAYSSIVEKDYYHTQHFSEFRGIAKKVKELDEKYGKENITRTISVFSPYYIQYYLDYYNHKTDFAQIGILTSDEIKSFNKLVETSNTPYFLYSFSNVYDDPELDLVIRSKYPYLIERDSMLNSGLKFYTRLENVASINRVPVKIYNYGFESNEWDKEAGFHDSLIVYEGKYSVHLSPDKEYGPGLFSTLKKLGTLPGSRIELSAVFYTDGKVDNGKLVLSIEKDGKNYLWTSSELKKYVGKPSEWTRVFLAADIPADLTGDEKISIYSWNEKKEDYRMDDFRMKIYSTK